MPAHDWTLVEAGIFHAFHTVWIGAIQNSLNEGLLPRGYYALAEQHAGRSIADVLTLHASPALAPPPLPPLPPDTGGIAVAEAAPRVRRRKAVKAPEPQTLRRSLAIRHVSGHRLVALLEIVSPANKDRRQHVDEFASKASSALRSGIHVLLVDLFPPGPCDPVGMHNVLVQEYNELAEPDELPAGEPLTLASYVAGLEVEVYLEHLAVGAPLPEMPLFLRPDRYVNVPLEPTYQTAYRGMPSYWRDVLEGRPPQV